MLPEIKIINEIDTEQSVVYLTGAGVFPGDVPLTVAESVYAKKRFSENDDIVHINSFYKSTFIVKVKEDIPWYGSLEELREAACLVGEIAQKLSVPTLTISPFALPESAAEAFAEGLVLSMYRFNRYKTNEKANRQKFPGTIFLHGQDSSYDIRKLRSVLAATFRVRDLINEPVITMNTSNFVKEIVKMGEHTGFTTEVLGRSRIESLRMGGLLAVNRGSSDPPAFVVAEWKPEGYLNQKPLVLVGKGVVYDTGGMNIKTGTYMDGMKSDMAGAAAVAGVMYSVAETRLPLHVITLIPVTDNRVSGNALVSGDIITMQNGKTVEVLNTDAEGRLILADALSYSSLFDPMLVISVATLTGSAAATFSHIATAMMGNAGDEMFYLLTECGNEVYERVAQLPFWKEYGDAMKSDIADLKNIDNREAGAIKAGKFLENFVTAPFIHLDIAGPGYLSKDDHYRKKEGPGTGMRLLYNFCTKLASQRFIKSKEWKEKRF
jgi:leucyl aminopeptidase